MDAAELERLCSRRVAFVSAEPWRDYARVCAITGGQEPAEPVLQERLDADPDVSTRMITGHATVSGQLARLLCLSVSAANPCIRGMDAVECASLATRSFRTSVKRIPGRLVAQYGCKCCFTETKTCLVLLSFHYAVRNYRHTKTTTIRMSTTTTQAQTEREQVTHFVEHDHDHVMLQSRPFVVHAPLLSMVYAWQLLGMAPFYLSDRLGRHPTGADTEAAFVEDVRERVNMAVRVLALMVCMASSSVDLRRLEASACAHTDGPAGPAGAERPSDTETEDERTDWDPRRDAVSALLPAS